MVSFENKSLWFASLLCLSPAMDLSKSFRALVNWINPSKDVYIFILGISGFNFVWQKELGRCDYIRILRWGDYPDYLGVPNVITGIHIRGRLENKVGEGNVMMKTKMGVMQPQAEAISGSWKRQGADFPGASKGNQPCWYLDFNLIKLILDFRPPKL